MCAGGHCPRSRPGLYALSPDDSKPKGTATSQTPLFGLLLLLPLAVLLLQRWWTPASSNQTLKLRVWRTMGTDKEFSFWGKRLELCQKQKKTFWGQNEHFLWPRAAKIDNSLDFILLSFFVVVWVWFSLLSWFQWMLTKKTAGRRWRWRGQWYKASWWLLMRRRRMIRMVTMIYWLKKKVEKLSNERFSSDMVRSTRLF